MNNAMKTSTKIILEELIKVFPDQTAFRKSQVMDTGKKFGYTGEQIYALLSSAPVEGHISGIVDIPNACATLFLPTDIFDFNVKPVADGPFQAVPPGVDVARALS